MNKFKKKSVSLHNWQTSYNLSFAESFLIFVVWSVAFFYQIRQVMMRNDGFNVNNSWTGCLRRTNDLIILSLYCVFLVLCWRDSSSTGKLTIIRRFQRAIHEFPSGFAYFDTSSISNIQMWTFWIVLCILIFNKNFYIFRNKLCLVRIIYVNYVINKRYIFILISSVKNSIVQIDQLKITDFLTNNRFFLTEIYFDAHSRFDGCL